MIKPYNDPDKITNYSHLKFRDNLLEYLIFDCSNDG